MSYVDNRACTKKANARKNIKLDPELLDGLKALAKSKGYPRLMDYLRHISKEYIEKTN